MECKPHEKVIFLFYVNASPSHQRLTWLWPWSSVSSHTLNAGCLALCSGSALLLLACSACSLLDARLALVFVWWRSLSPKALVMCNWPLTAEDPVHCEVCEALWLFHHSNYCPVLFFSPRGSNLTDIQHTDVYKSRCGLSRTGRVGFFLLLSVPLILCYGTQHLLLCRLLFLTLFLFLYLTLSLTLFSGADSSESAVERGIGKKLLFDNVCLSVR